jgi:hypothetical protein
MRDGRTDSSRQHCREQVSAPGSWCAPDAEYTFEEPRPLFLGSPVDLTVSEAGATRIVDRKDAVPCGSEIIEPLVGIMRHRRIMSNACDTSNWRG